MTEERQDPREQIGQWLKKLERESWQLELLVSAFTIFLLLMAIGAYSDFLEGITYEYDLSDNLLSFIYLFLALLGTSIRALVIFLILHLLLRGFWIGTIGLRSVQAKVDFDKLNYGEFFTEKLKKKVISLDSLVIMLDEICSLIFSFAFLVLSMLLAFGLYVIFFGVLAFALSSITNAFSGVMATIIGVTSAIVFLGVLLTGLVYFIDYFTLGFFKKYRWLSRIYYPFYRFYGAITLSVISKSIYYYLISKFSKKRIRIVYFIAGVVVLFLYLTEYDQYQFYSDNSDSLTITSNYYDNLRSPGDYVEDVSIQSNIVSGQFLQLFVRYDPRDNEKISSNCPDFVPAKNKGLNWSMSMKSTDQGLVLTGRDFDGENKEQLLECLGSLYEISVNDSIYRDVKFYYHLHPSKEQKGIVTMIDASSFVRGENILRINKLSIDEDGEQVTDDFAYVPFWYH